MTTVEGFVRCTDICQVLGEGMVTKRLNEEQRRRVRAGRLLLAGKTPAQVRISGIVDARFSLIVDDETASSRARRGGAQAPVVNVAQPSTISLKRAPAEVVLGLILGLD